MTKVIAIDAGHGHNTAGRTTDKRYDPNQTDEWDLNNRLATLEEQYLKAYDVIIVRLDDRTGVKDVSLKERTDKANANNCDFVISNHHNAGGGNGLESFYDKRVSINSSEYKMYQQIHQAVIQSTNQRDRGLKSSSQSAPGDLAILRDTSMPAILIEAGFMDHPIDTPRIISDEFASKYASGVVNGLVKVLQLEKKENDMPTNGNTNQGYQGNSIVDYLKSIGKNSSFNSRAVLAKEYGIKNYTGTASQNLLLLSKLKGGMVVMNYYPAVNSTSIVDALKSINVDSSLSYRTKIAVANGISNYTGTASQNIILLTLLRQGTLKRA